MKSTLQVNSKCYVPEPLSRFEHLDPGQWLSLDVIAELAERASKRWDELQPLLLDDIVQSVAGVMVDSGVDNSLTCYTWVEGYSAIEWEVEVELKSISIPDDRVELFPDHVSVVMTAKRYGKPTSVTICKMVTGDFWAPYEILLKDLLQTSLKIRNHRLRQKLANAINRSFSEDSIDTMLEAFQETDLVLTGKRSQPGGDLDSLQRTLTQFMKDRWSTQIYLSDLGYSRIFVGTVGLVEGNYVFDIRLTDNSRDEVKKIWRELNP